MCYTYDNLNRVTKRRIIRLDCNCVLSEENYSYDAAGNIIDAPNSCFYYDTNNRLMVFNRCNVSYDMDGNMLSNVETVFSYNSANRLITACDHTYTYNAEDVRICNLYSDANTTYTYNTNCKLSQLLTKTTNGVTTKYVYGNGLIGEEVSGAFKTYHFDFRGSTVAITDENGNIIDTFKYDTYGNVTEHIGNSTVIFGYNGRDGVVTDENGLIYMRARYYSPAMRRFVNADILHGEISDSTSLNRYSYVNGNPVSFVDPFGLAAERGKQILKKYSNNIGKFLLNFYNYIKQIDSEKVFNYVIEEMTGISQQEHYDRAQFYLDFPDVYSKDDPFFEGWVTETASCHQFTSSNCTNVKYISPDGKNEVIYDENNKEVLDVRDIGTYNYVSPKEDGMGHFMADVLPWIAWGNAQDDSTTLRQRLERFAVYGLQDKLEECNKNIINKLDKWDESIKEWWNGLW